MLSNFPKTTSEHWRRTPGTQKGSPISLKGGRTKYKRQKKKQKFTDRDPSWGRGCEGGAVVSKQQENLSLVGLWGVLESQRAPYPGGKKKQQYCSSPKDFHIVSLLPTFPIPNTPYFVVNP